MTNWAQAAWRWASDSALGATMVTAQQSRTTGLAAEAAFWGVFALPWLLLGLVAGITRVEELLGIDTLDQFRANVLEVATEVLTPEAINDLLIPLLDNVLGTGRSTLGLLGVLVAIWAGSRVIDAIVNAMAVIYQQEGLRGFVRAKLVSVGVYVAGLAFLIVVTPLILAGPALLTRLAPDALGPTVSGLLTIGQIVVVLLLLVSLYHWSVPHRTNWFADIPGALFAIALWLAFSWALRWYFAWIFREGSVYAAIAAPVAVMCWVYVSMLSLLLGAALNGTLAVRHGWYTPVAREHTSTGTAALRLQPPRPDSSAEKSVSS